MVAADTSRDEDSPRTGRPGLLSIVCLFLVCYSAGYGCMRVIGKNAAYGHDPYDDPDTTYFCDKLSIATALYYFYLPALVADKAITRREYRLTDTLD
ncbi:MAG: hypothetical protein ACYSU0_16955 [Planctomycetota bacterium]|jgi:hypothetical protein